MSWFNSRQRPRLTVEALEDRTAPAMLTVWRATDNVTEPGALRYALAQATDGDTWPNTM